MAITEEAKGPAPAGAGLLPFFRRRAADRGASPIAGYAAALLPSKGRPFPLHGSSLH
jgi:hypothetical protein